MTAATVDERIPAEIAEELARITFSYELVTPTQAKAWLAQQHPHQRKPGSLYAGKPKKYGDIMAMLGWDPAVPQPVMFIDPEVVINGLNRLTAVVLSNTPTILFIARHVPERIFDVIDTGRARFPGQFLNGGAPGSAQASAARWLMWYEDPERFARRPSGPAMSFELRDVVKYGTEHRDEIARAVREAGQVHGATGIPVAIHAAVLVLARRDGADESRLATWLTGLATGANLPEGDPRLVLRVRFSYRLGKRNAGMVADDWTAIVIALTDHLAGELSGRGQRLQSREHVWPRVNEPRDEFEHRVDRARKRRLRVRTTNKIGTRLGSPNGRAAADARVVEELVLTTGATLP